MPHAPNTTGPRTRNPIKNWFLTFPQCGDLSPTVVRDHIMTLDTVKEYLIATELHEDGGRHLHCFFKFTRGVTHRRAMTEFDVLGHHGNYQPTKSCKDVICYCIKEGDYIANFDVEKYKQKKGKVTSETLQTYSAIEALDAGIINVNQLRNYNYARGEALQPTGREPRCGFWFWGEPGVGKSWYAHHDVCEPSQIFVKNHLKWWDGYNGEEYVIIDDLGRSFTDWDEFKQWSDTYPIRGQIKGGVVALRYEKIIVTSNYSPDDLVKDDPILLEAIKRRFRIVHFQRNTYSLLTGKPRAGMTGDTPVVPAPPGFAALELVPVPGPIIAEGPFHVNFNPPPPRPPVEEILLTPPVIEDQELEFEDDEEGSTFIQAIEDMLADTEEEEEEANELATQFS